MRHLPSTHERHVHGIGAVQVGPQLHVRTWTEQRNPREIIASIENLDVVSMQQHFVDDVHGLGGMRRACDVRQYPAAA